MSPIREPDTEQAPSPPLPEAEMDYFAVYRRTQVAEMRPYRAGESLEGVSVSQLDRNQGSPKAGDLIARNPKNHKDQWLVSAEYAAENFERLRGVTP